MNEKERFIFFDIMRIILTLLVVLGHMNFTGFDSNKYTGAVSWFISRQQTMLTWIYTFHMAAFMFLSGACFRVEKYYSFDQLVIEKLKRLVVPTFGMALFIILPFKLITGMLHGTTEALVVVNDLLRGTGDYTQFWFMLALFWVFFFSYFPIRYIYIYIYMRPKHKNAVLAFIAIYLIARYLPRIDMENLFLFKTGLSYLVVFFLGYLFKDREMYRYLSTGSCIVYQLLYWGLMSQSGNIELNFYVLQLLGITFCVTLSFLIEKLLVLDEKAKKCVAFLAKRTKYVYYYHVLIIWGFSLYLYRYYNTNIEFVLGAILLLLSCMLVPFAIEKGVDYICALQKRKAKL